MFEFLLEFFVTLCLVYFRCLLNLFYIFIFWLEFLLNLFLSYFFGFETRLLNMFKLFLFKDFAL